MILVILLLFETKDLLRYMKDITVVFYNQDIHLLFRYMEDTVAVCYNQDIQLPFRPMKDTVIVYCN